MVMETILAKSNTAVSPAPITQRKVRPRPAEPPTPAVTAPPRIQAIHAGKEGFILRGASSQTFWEW
jgi:hypothetical protein